MLGVATGPVAIDATTLVDRLPADDASGAGATAHPLAQVHQAAVDVARAQEEVLCARTDLPRVYVQSSVFARGSGANPNGQLDGGLSRPRPRPRQLGGRCAGGVSQRVRLQQPARAQGGGGGVDACGDGAVRRGAS